jgi:predicted signal transduction protein with EAL and GGDEF domain
VALGLATRAQLERHLADPRRRARAPTSSKPNCCAPTARRGAGGDQLAAAGGWASKLLIAVARDISERLQAQQRLKHMASYDSLTGLPNRTLFFQNLRDAIELAQDKNWRVAVLFITLDRFKIVNDSLGPRWATSCCASSAPAWCAACACATPSAAWAATSSR